jgi:hypothetical protein
MIGTEDERHGVDQKNATLTVTRRNGSNGRRWFGVDLRRRFPFRRQQPSLAANESFIRGRKRKEEGKRRMIKNTFSAFTEG